MGATGSPETSVWNHVTPRNNPEYGSRSYPLLCAMYITFLFIIYTLCYYMYIIIHFTYLLYMSYYILFVLHLLFLKDQDILEHYPFHKSLVSRTAISFHVFRITFCGGGGGRDTSWGQALICSSHLLSWNVTVIVAAIMGRHAAQAVLFDNAYLCTLTETNFAGYFHVNGSWRLLRSTKVI
jgi:hypothetical protein